MKTNTLIIHCTGDQLQHCRWQIADLHHQPQSGGWQDIPAEMLSLPSYVIVPGEKISIKQINLPDRKLAKNQQALAYAIEDELISDIEQLKIMLLNQPSENNNFVAIIDKSILKNWLSLLQSRLTNIQAIVPDMFCLPWQANHWAMATNDGMVLLRLNQYQAYSLDKTNLCYFLHSLLAENITQPYVIDCYSDDKELTTQLEEQQFVINQHDDLNLAAQLTQQVPVLNLAPQPRKSRSKKITFNKQGLILGLLLLAWLLIIATLNLMEQSQLATINHTLQHQIEQTYFAIFPQATTVVAPETRVSQELKHLLHNQANTHQLLQMLNSVGKTLAKVQARMLTIEYQPGQLIITVQFTAQLQLQQFLKVLAQQGIQVTKQQFTDLTKKLEVQLWLKQ